MAASMTAISMIDPSNPVVSQSSTTAVPGASMPSAHCRGSVCGVVTGTSLVLVMVAHGTDIH